MDGNLQTSFIPSKPLVEGAGGPKRTVNLFSLISTILFVTMLILAGAAFGYEWYQGQQIASAQQELNDMAKKFDPDLIKQLTKLDGRIEAAKMLLSNHFAVSNFFDFLSTVTLQNVRFSSFNFSQKNNQYYVSFSGLAQNFAALDLQALEMQKPENLKYLQSPLFSDFSLDQKGNVTFSLTGTVPNNAFSYRSSLASIAQPAAAPVATGTPATSTPQQQ